MSCASPRHGEHDVKRNRERLRAVDVCETRRVGYDGVRHKGRAGRLVGVDTRPPAALQYCLDHYPLLLYVTGKEAIHARDKTRVLDHKGHQFRGVTTDREEFKPRLEDE